MLKTWCQEVKFCPWCYLWETSWRAPEPMTSAVCTCPQRKARPLGTMRRLTSKSAPIQRVGLQASNPLKACSRRHNGAGRAEIALRSFPLGKERMYGMQVYLASSSSWIERVNQDSAAGAGLYGRSIRKGVSRESIRKTYRSAFGAIHQLVFVFWNCLQLQMKVERLSPTKTPGANHRNRVNPKVAPEEFFVDKRLLRKC